MATSFNQGFKTQANAIWNCDFHVVIVPKYRKHVLFVSLANQVKSAICEFALKRDTYVVECLPRPDHVRMVLRIPPKYAPTQVVEFLKGACSSRLIESFSKERQHSNVLDSIWARGYCISTKAIDESIIENLVQEQWTLDKALDGPELELSWS